MLEKNNTYLLNNSNNFKLEKYKFNKKKLPDRKEIIDNLSGQLCRCGSHASVLKAVNNLIEKRKMNG